MLFSLEKNKFGYKVIIDGINNPQYFFSIKPYDFSDYPALSAADAIADGLSDFAEEFGIVEDNLVCLEQIHGNKIIQIKDSFEHFKIKQGVEKKCVGDALMTRIPNVFLGIKTADCLPVVCYDKRKKILGIAHAGWRGTYKKISQKLLQNFISDYKSEPDDVMVIIGPGIRQCCYEVGIDLASKFKRSITVKNKKYYFDLAGENAAQLKKMGIKEKNILDLNICTCCRSNEFYSFRESQASARMLNLVGFY